MSSGGWEAARAEQAATGRPAVDSAALELPDAGLGPDDGFAWRACDRAPQLPLWAGAVSGVEAQRHAARELRGFDDRAAAVAYARRRSLSGIPCDVYDRTGACVYRRELDVAATRAQRGLFDEVAR